jgi:hypothetical protein
MRFNICLAALVASTAFASPAFAQAATANALAEARGLVLERLTLTKKEDLDFGTVISSATAGSVRIDADTGGRTVLGGVTAVPANVGKRGLFEGAGTVGQTYLLSMTRPAFLVSTTNSTDVIAVTSMFFDNGNLPAARTIGLGGTFKVGVGGVFAIAASQPNGYYQADFTVTADYQ